MKTHEERNLISLALKRCGRSGIHRIASVQILLCLASATCTGCTGAEISHWTQIEPSTVINHCKRLAKLGLLAPTKATRGDKREVHWTLTSDGHDLISGRR